MQIADQVGKRGKFCVASPHLVMRDEQIGQA